jgi:hypothetical protein
MLIMRRFLFHCALFGALVVTAAVATAQEAAPADIDPTVTKWTAEKIDNPPKRELKFERSDEPLNQRLPSLTPFDVRVSPSVLEQKFVAVLLVNSRPPVRSILDGPTLPQQFEGLVKATPKDHLPPEAEVAFFTSPDITYSYYATELLDNQSGRFRGPPRLVEIRILAPTAESAEARAAAMLTLFEQGAARTYQHEAFQIHQQLAEKWRSAHEAVAAAEAKIPELETSLKEYLDYDASMLPALRTQQMQIEIERAGVKAEIEAAQKLIADGNRETQAKVEGFLLPAQIRLAGIDARQALTNQLLEKVRKKSELSQELLDAKNRRDTKRTLERQLADELKRTQQRLDSDAPLQVVNNVVHIRPVNWTK